MEKKNILTYEGLQKLENELQDLKLVKRKEIAQKIKEAILEDKSRTAIVEAVKESINEQVAKRADRIMYVL